VTDEFVPAHVKGLDVYQPGKPIEELERELGITGAIKVASNENPLGPSPRALAALPAALPQLHLYPDAGGFALRRALADKLGVGLAGGDLRPDGSAAEGRRGSIDLLALGNGSNDILYQLVLATCGPGDEVLTHKFAFLSYRLAAQIPGQPFIAVPTTAEYACDVSALIAAITPKTKLVVLGTPNNPTGSVVSRADAERVVAALPARALLVIDEAYAEYAAAWPEVDHADGMALFRAHPRVIVLRTFSKIYGLAGLRVGYAIAPAAVCDVLGRVGRTFHVSSLAHAGAIAALADDEHVRKSAAQARRAIEKMREEIRGPGVRVFPSLANFVMIDCGKPSTPIYEKLLRKGVIVRPLAAWGLPSCLRVSGGRDQDMPRVIGAINECLA
jgi:histidinol-phosphate aminotransferase